MRIAGALAVAAILLLLLASKLWLVASYGSGVPFWDQWDAEAAYLFDPWVQGTLTLADLLSAHNEHRILFTRLLALALLQANGVWNPWLEMAVNAVLHVAAIGLAIVTAWRAAGRGTLPILLGLALSIFLLPYGWENTLSGFQSQFYFVLLFAIGALWLLVVSPPLGIRWCVGLVLGWMAFFSLASGAVVFAAAGGILLTRAVVLRDGRELAGAGVLAVLFSLAAALVPSVEYHAALRAQSLSALLHGASIALAWPFTPVSGVFLRNAPAVLLASFLLWRRPPARDPLWFLLAFCAWTIAQEVSLAYGRAAEVLAPRYLDLHALGLFANAASLLALLSSQAGVPRRLPAWVAVAWMVPVAAGLASGLLDGQLATALQDKRAASARQQANLQRYLASGDRNALRGLPAFALPYPSADRLAAILSSQRIRAILPSELNTGPTHVSGRLDALVQRTFRSVPRLASLALALLAIAWLLVRRGQAAAACKAQ